MIKPMLAHKLNENKIDWNKPVYMQPKLDGVRCLFTKDGAFSRTGKQFMNVQHIEEDLKRFFIERPDIILDGELYNHNLKHDFEKIISLVRKQKPTNEDRIEAKKLTQYHVYDYIDYPAITYKERLNNLTTSDIYNEHIKYVLTSIVVTPAMTKVIHQEYLDMGYEGSILRTDTPYKHGRSWGLISWQRQERGYNR